MPTREELELRKLELEVRELERSSWLRPAYMAALLPIVLATLGFLSAWMSGYFSNERAKLKQETAQLQSERKTLIQERDNAQRAREALFEVIKYANRVLGGDASPTPTPADSN